MKEYTFKVDSASAIGKHGVLSVVGSRDGGQEDFETIGAALELEAADATPVSTAGAPGAVKVSAVTAAQRPASGARREWVVLMNSTPSVCRRGYGPQAKVTSRLARRARADPSRHAGGVTSASPALPDWGRPANALGPSLARRVA